MASGGRAPVTGGATAPCKRTELAAGDTLGLRRPIRFARTPERVAVDSCGPVGTA